MFEQASESRPGFNKGVAASLLDQCLVLNGLLHGGVRLVALLDISQAYDGVCRELLWAKCRQRDLSVSRCPGVV